MIDKSVRNTVELQYNSSNVAVLQTFDLLQEGVGMIIINIVVIISVTTIIIIVNCRSGLSSMTTKVTDRDNEALAVSS